MRFLYDLVYIIFVMSYLPVFLVKIKQAESKKRLLLDRAGFLSPEVKKSVAGRAVIWIHTVSVGETLGVKVFLEYLQQQLPQYMFVLSTVTPTGNKVARTLTNGNVTVIYLPLDISWITRRVMSLLKPQMLILMETELWPNLILAAHTQGTNVAIINGRISPKSFRNYYRIRKLLANVFAHIDQAFMQTDEDAQRLKEIGICAERIHVTGNMKFDAVIDRKVSTSEADAMRRNYGFLPDDLVFIGASTHPREEAILCEVYKRLKKVYPKIKLLLVPRHIERVNDIIEEVTTQGLSYVVRDSYLVTEEGMRNQTKTGFDVYILNTIGELNKLYTFSDVVFVGGSFIPHGGQNPLEAIACQKPVLSGPYYFNFAFIYQELQKLHAVTVVESPDELCEAVNALLGNTDLRKQVAQSAGEWLHAMQGASKRNGDAVISLISAQQ